MKELVAKIQAEYATFSENAEAQVSKNNKAAGTRARKAALELSKLMKEFRKASVVPPKQKAVPKGRPFAVAMPRWATIRFRGGGNSPNPPG